MEVIISTNIRELEDDALQSSTVLNNYLKGTSDSDSFIVESVDVKKIRIPFADAETFSINIFDYIKVNKDKAAFIHIYCYNVVSSPSESPIPVTFRVSLSSDGEASTSIVAGDLILGKMSQFQIANVTEFDSEITLSKFDITTDKIANLIIIVGSKL